MLETWEIRRPLPSLSLGWAAGGITAGVRTLAVAWPRLLPTTSVACSFHICRTCFCQIPGHACLPNLSSFHPLPSTGHVCCQMVLATFLATICPLPGVCCQMVFLWRIVTWPDGILHSGLKTPPAASTLCRTCFCHVPGHACRLSFSSFHPLGLTEFPIRSMATAILIS